MSENDVVRVLLFSSKGFARDMNLGIIYIYIYIYIFTFVSSV